MADAKFTYKDWWEGKVYLDTCTITHKKGEDVRIMANFKDFVKTDTIKIKKKQKEIFAKESNALFNVFVNEFKTRYKNSEVKTAYLKGEFKDLELILNSTPKENPRFYNRNFRISSEDLSDMRRYVVEQIIRGKKDYSFIHSPNYPFRIKNKIPAEIYARASWEYFKWLKESVKDSRGTEKRPAEVREGKNDKSEPPSKRLKIPVIALIQFYKGVTITRENSNEIAAKYGYISKTSGEGLYQDYLKYAENSMRSSLNDDSSLKNKRKLKLLLDVASHLEGDPKTSAEQDAAKLEKLISEHVW